MWIPIHWYGGTNGHLCQTIALLLQRPRQRQPGLRQRQPGLRQRQCDRWWGRLGSLRRFLPRLNMGLRKQQGPPLQLVPRQLALEHAISRSRWARCLTLMARCELRLRRQAWLLVMGTFRQPQTMWS